MISWYYFFKGFNAYQIVITDTIVEEQNNIIVLRIDACRLSAAELLADLMT